MSIQDDIFDVEDVLKGKPEAESFDRIIEYLFRIERDAESGHKMLNSIKEGMRALKFLLEEST